MLEEIYNRFRKRAEFFVVYIREAHPSDGWQMESNERQGIVVKQPKTEEQRVDVARTCQKGMDISIPMLIDDMGNSVGEAYAGWPDRLYIVGEDGRIAYKGNMGPRGFRPREMEQVLEKMFDK